MKLCKEIQDYLDIVEAPGAIVCPEQIMLAKLVRKVFETEQVYVDEEQLARYLSYQKYFPYALFDWETFLFALFCCTYHTVSGLPRFSKLVGLGGRGLGKNGFISYVCFCLSSEANGIKNYNIDIFATAEDQARRSFDDIHSILEANSHKLSRFFKWNLEKIVNLKTGSTIAYHTSSAKTKDGARPGMVVYDEIHAYEKRALINVTSGGLGKVEHPRELMMTTQGDIRGAVLDDELEDCMKILTGEKPDGGKLPFLNRLSDISKVHDPKYWVEANPTLYYVGKSKYADTLFNRMLSEYNDYKDDPISHSAFATKRMNLPQGNVEIQVTSWENNTACSRDIGNIVGKPCVMGTDYASTQDFVAVGYMFLVGGEIKWLTHSWVCKHSKDLPRIKYPVNEAEMRSELTIVDDIEISPELPAAWLLETKEKYRLNVLGGAIDHFRYTILSKALKEIGYIPEHREGGEIVGNLKLVRPSDISMIAPLLCLEFERKSIAWGENNHTMQWYTNNTKKVTDSKGNVHFEKIEPKSRKTDGFMALAAARTQLYRLEPYDKADRVSSDLGVWTY